MSILLLLLALVTPAWASVSQAEPPGRGAAVVVYAPERDALVVYGGIGAEPRAWSDLWEWRDGGWHERWSDADSGPGDRFNHAGAWHSDTGMLVVQGGGGIDERLGDTWGWKQEGWTHLAGDARDDSGPGVRSCARMVERTATGELIFYGGEDETGRIRSETWSWDGSTWTLLDSNGPPGGCFHGLAYDADRDRVVLFGGRGAGDDTWEWDGRRWERVAHEGPPARDHHAMAWDAAMGRTIVFGGGGHAEDGEWDGSVLGDTWAWDGSTWSALPDDGPTRFHAPGMAYAPSLGGLILFGGSDRAGSYADLWRLEGHGWVALAPDGSAARIAPTEPGPRSSHAMTWDPGSRSVVMMGGLDRPDGIWSWEGSRWERIGDADDPGSRAHMALTWIPGTDELMVQGGFEARRGHSAGWEQRYGDTWIRSASGEWRRVTDHDVGPGIRDHHAMVADPARGEVLLFGGGWGVGRSTLLGDTWLWREGAWHPARAEGPSARATHRLVYDTDRERVILFGGAGDDGLLNDLWEWDGERWIERTPSEGPMPSPRFASRMAYDEARGVMVLFGGRGAEGDLADTWLWDGATGRWTELPVQGPPTRNVHGMAYDRSRQVVILYGGFHSGETYSDTWEWDGDGWGGRSGAREGTRFHRGPRALTQIHLHLDSARSSANAAGSLTSGSSPSSASRSTATASSGGSSTDASRFPFATPRPLGRRRTFTPPRAR